MPLQHGHYIEIKLFKIKLVHMVWCVGSSFNSTYYFKNIQNINLIDHTANGSSLRSVICFAFYTTFWNSVLMADTKKAATDQILSGKKSSLH